MGVPALLLTGHVPCLRRRSHGTHGNCPGALCVCVCVHVCVYVRVWCYTMYVCAMADVDTPTNQALIVHNENLFGGVYVCICVYVCVYVAWWWL